MQFRVFLGLIGSVQPPAVRRAQAALNQAMAAQAEHDDDDDEDEMPNAGSSKERTILIGDQSMPDAPYPPPPSSTMTEEERQQRREYYHEVRNVKSDRFLNDAESCVKIFLSGYYRDRGLM